MIKDVEILEDIKKIRLKTELLANPLYNDFLGSHFWSNIDERLENIIKDIEKDLEYYESLKKLIY